MSDALKRFIGTGLGTGYLRPAPGSWGSLAACGVMAAVLWATGGDFAALNVAAIAIVVVASVACVALGRFMEAAFKRKDPGQSTLDEWAGQAVTILGVPLGTGQHGWLAALGVGFIVFRLLDSIKPPPIRLLEKLPYGWGVLCDDLLAGVYSNIITQLILRLWLLPWMAAGAGGG
jgi:phosphatidylglycerophosphatase A